MKIKILFLFSLAVLFTSCKKDEKATILSDSSASVNANSEQIAKQRAAGMLLPQNQNPVAPNVVAPNQTAVVSPDGKQIQVQPQNGQNQQVIAPGMNPPHGKPGHRCDIPVGAPLNSAKTAAPQQITVNPSSAKPDPNAYNVTPKPTTPVKTAPGMNPPHGEPGHRCDIAVGAPLSSPPGKTPAQNATPNIQTSAPASLPATVAAPANNAPALDANGKPLTVNPAHGQPGHRCDISVGAPLK